jgi:hypothetical protein
MGDSRGRVRLDDPRTAEAPAPVPMGSARAARPLMKRMLPFGAMHGRRKVQRLAFAIAAPCLIVPAFVGYGTGHVTEARASVSVAVTLDALVRSASAVVLATAEEQRAIWEGGRIYTYSRLRVDTAVAGELAQGNEVWVRTMGGIAGGVGQVVEGEAVFAPGHPSLVFLRHGSGGGTSPFVVAARAQGQFAIYADDEKQLRFRRSPATGGLVPAGGTGASTLLAADAIDGRVVADATVDLAAAWARAHVP